MQRQRERLITKYPKNIFHKVSLLKERERDPGIQPAKKVIIIKNYDTIIIINNKFLQNNNRKEKRGERAINFEEPTGMSYAKVQIPESQNIFNGTKFT